MLRLNETRDEVGVVADQRGNPTSALDIADALIAIATRTRDNASPALRGIFHMTGAGEATWADFAESHLPRGRGAGPAADPVKTHCNRRLSYPCAKAGQFAARQRKACSRISPQTAVMAEPFRSRLLRPPFVISLADGPSARRASVEDLRTLMQRKVLVTGGAGFIGSALIRHLIAEAPRCSTSIRSPTPAISDRWRRDEQSALPLPSR